VLDVLADEGYAYDASFMPDRNTEQLRRVAYLAHPGDNTFGSSPNGLSTSVSLLCRYRAGITFDSSPTR